MIAGRYELDREIGRGGMGAVWLARDTTLGRDVAVKRLGGAPPGAGPDEGPTDGERAGREARLAARLNHPHVVHVFDLVHEDGGQWLVMEYVEGQTLASMIRGVGALAPDRAAAIVRQAADALAAAHAAGIVHRDVKPSNILVDPREDVKLTDFGIARAEADPSLTQTGLVTGSPAYLSPEVASGRVATQASDVWSLGATLYHALSGHPPYEVGENLMGALFRIVHEDPPRLPDAGWLAPLLESTMTTEPEDRWSMAEVRDYLHSGGRSGAPEATQRMGAVPPVATAPLSAAVPAAAPAAAAPPPTSATAKKTSERRPRRGWLPLAVAAALVVVLALAAWTLLRDDGDESPTIARPPSSEGPSGGGSQEPSQSPSQSPSQTPSESPSESPSEEPDEPTARGMESFITDYLSTAPSSPETGFEMLTPGFQQASGGFSGYSGYWNTIAAAEPVSISADPDALVVTYEVAYTRQDGSQTVDAVQLQLEYADGRYLIADEA